MHFCDYALAVGFNGVYAMKSPIEITPLGWSLWLLFNDAIHRADRNAHTHTFVNMHTHASHIHTHQDIYRDNT